MTSSAALRAPAARSAGPARLPASRLPATWLLVAAVAVANTLLLFRHSLLSGFAQISGDPWDGRIALSLFEHWHRVLTLQSPWRSPLFFHPAADALGYSDAFFLHGVIYSLGRAAGLDQYVSYELVAVAFKLIGFFGFYGLARRLLRVRTGWALVGASVFFQLNATALQLNHQQLLVLAVFPSLVELAVAFALALAAGRRLRALGLGLAAAALGAACLMSGLYMSWYLSLFAAAVAVLYALLAPRQAIAGLRRAAAAAIAGGWVVPVLLACAACCCCPRSRPTCRRPAKPACTASPRSGTMPERRSTSSTSAPATGCGAACSTPLPCG
ncbi:MAG: hypothetical protein U1E53_13135 [Dongiaceae bacterium]